MNITKEQIEIMETLNVEQMSKEEIDDVVTINNIVIGEKEEDEFEETIRFGIAMPKEGRIPFNVVEENLDVIWTEIENIKGFPGDTINTGMFTTKLVSKDEKFFEEFVDGMKDRRGRPMKEEQKKYRKMREEALVLIEKGLKWNDNLIWTLWKIIRGRRQRAFMEKSGESVDFKIELYSYIHDETLDAIIQKFRGRF